MSFQRLKADAKFILTNRILIYIPSWTIRRFFLRRLGMRIGNNSRIGIGTVIIQPETIIIGNNTYINEFCHLDGRGGLIIGDNVSISIYSKIITASHRANSDSFEYYDEQTLVEDHVWLGCNAIVLNGSILGKYSIIGAGCVIKGRTDPYGIYVGNPSNKIKTREKDIDYQLIYNPYFR